MDRSGEFISQLPFSEKTCQDIPVPGTQLAQPSCQWDVHLEAFRRTCGCEHATMLDSLESQRRLNVCKPLDMIACRDLWAEYSHPEVRQSRHATTSRRCRPPCQKIIYSVVADDSPIKRAMLDNVEFFVGSPPTDSARNVTFSVVMLFYPTLISKTVQLSKATLMEWLSAFGGQLSLFIGASVITMLEMLFFCGRLLTVLAGRVFGRLFGKDRVASLVSK